MRSILLGDTHLGIKNSNLFWLDLTYQLFQEIVDYCIKNDISNIIHGGDFFHTRYSLNVLTISYSYKIVDLLRKNNIHMYICIGNHDQYYKKHQKHHALMIFEKYSNITIIDTPTELDDEILCPWNTLPDKTNKKTLIGHYEINGVVTNASGYEMTSAKLSITDFNQFDKVYSSHFHTKSSNSNIEYIGSAFAMDMNDINSERGYYLYEGGYVRDFIEFTTAPKFVRFTSTDDFDNIDIKNNICKVIFIESCTDIESMKIVDKIKGCSPKELFIDFQIKNEDQVEEKSFIGTNSDMILHYIDNIITLPIGLEKTTLKSYVKKLDKDLV